MPLLLPTEQVDTPHLLKTSSRQAASLLPHKDYERAQLLLFAGKKDQGKTTALKSYIEICEPRVFILDPFDDFATVRQRLDLADALRDMAEGGPGRRRVVPPLVVEDENGEIVKAGSREYAHRFFKLAIASLRNCLVVLDEMSLWSGNREDAILQAVILQGRRLGLRLAVACQRIQLIPGVMLSEATEMVLFKMRRPRDLEVVKEWAGEDVAAQLPKLKQGECIILNDL